MLNAFHPCRNNPVNGRNAEAEVMELNNEELLTSIFKTTEMGKTGIRAVLKAKIDPNLQSALREQLSDYQGLRHEALCLASQRGWKLKTPDFMLQKMIEKMTRMRIGHRHMESRIADMVIQGNTQGMVHSLRDLHRTSFTDLAITDLAQRLLACETENIRQMKPYL